MRFNSAVVLVEFAFVLKKAFAKLIGKLSLSKVLNLSVKGLKIQANFSQLCCDYTNKGAKVLLSLLCGSFL